MLGFTPGVARIYLWRFSIIINEIIHVHCLNTQTNSLSKDILLRMLLENNKHLVPCVSQDGTSIGIATNYDRDSPHSKQVQSLSLRLQHSGVFKKWISIHCAIGNSNYPTLSGRIHVWQKKWIFHELPSFGITVNVNWNKYRKSV